MTMVYKLRRGLNIRLEGKASRDIKVFSLSEKIALSPEAFQGVTPKVVVQKGEHVKAGQTLFINKHNPEIGFSSPVSGIIEEVHRGERRKVLSVIIKTDKSQEYVDFPTKDVSKLSSKEVISLIKEAGLFGWINRLPYAISACDDTIPKGIFISALRDKPLASDFEVELDGNEEDFQAGLTALSKIAPTYLGIGPSQTSKSLVEAKDVSINIFDGPCPAGNVGVQVNHISPVNKGEIVWTIDPMVVIFFGRLFRRGKVDLHRRIAITGSQIKTPMYAETIVGEKISHLLKDNLKEEKSDALRIINGNVLSGRKTSIDGFLDAHASEITVIPEGENKHEFIGWIMPRLKEFSVNRSYFSWLQKKKEYRLDARIKGGKRHIIMSGEYDSVIPMNIYAEYLIKAIIVGDIDKMEALGIYEVAPEDFALAEFVDSSKQELQKIVRFGLDMLRKENS